MDKKFKAFLEIAKTLNEHDIVPIIYGSLGFYHLIGQQLDEVGDIDIVISNTYYGEKFDELKNIMKEIGYERDPNYPREFTKGEVQIGFEPESDLANLNIDSKSLKVSEIEGAKFKELSLADYLKVYKRNLATHEAKLLKIKNKIEVIENLLTKK